MRRFGPAGGVLVLTMLAAPSFGQDPSWIDRSTPPPPPRIESLIDELYRTNGKGGFGDAKISRGTVGGPADGKVFGLNATTFAAVDAARRQDLNSAFTKARATTVVLAVLSDDRIDDVEVDLLQELTQGQFRGITVTLAGDNGAKVVIYTVYGDAKALLKETLVPPLSLERAWAQGADGWNELVKAYKSSDAEAARVLYFVLGKLETEWGQSNTADAYRPFRNVIAQKYGYSGMPGMDAITGRKILRKACEMLDKKASGAVPDFLYTWIKDV